METRGAETPMDFSSDEKTFLTCINQDVGLEAPFLNCLPPEVYLISVCSLIKEKLWCRFCLTCISILMQMCEDTFINVQKLLNLSTPLLTLY